MAGVGKQNGKGAHEARTARNRSKELSSLLRCILSHTQIPDSSSVVSKLSLLINYLLGKRLGYARGEDGKALKSPF